MVLADQVSSTVLRSVSFTTFRAEDIRKLSVKEITNATTFDTLGHVTSGGLHDPALGPEESTDVCATCGQNGVHCPGHMGHITFPLPVYNPLFFRTLFTVLRASCFSCHRFLAQSERILIAINQHKLLQYGLTEKAQELVAKCTEYLYDVDPKLTAMQEEEAGEKFAASTAANKDVLPGLVSLIDGFINEALKDVNKKQAAQASLQKNLVDIREKIKKEISLLTLVKFPRRCVHCNALRRPLRNQFNSKIFFTSKAVHAERRKKRRAARDVGERFDEEAAGDEPEEYISDEEDEAEEESQKTKTERTKLLSNLKDQVYLTPLQAREHLRALWDFEESRQILTQIFGAMSRKTEGYPTDVFFLEIMPVPPTRFRPVQMRKGQKYENTQTANLSKALKSAQAITDVVSYMKKQRDQVGEPAGIPTQVAAIPGETTTEKLNSAWIRLQTSVNGIVDSALDKLSNNKTPGIKQLLEKKEGLFRKHMMGKRVDYAARSVISPDPYINMDEVGIPEVFATKLTYPEAVTPGNAAELRQAVINGPDVHPGASFVENEDGTKVKISHKDRVQREALAKQLLKPTPTNKCVLGRKKVYRHLRNGDILLLNRQPTLHRPSIQAHKARVLRGEKTLRLHYANCKAYNADFDGDEMNAHFPQNEVARAEAYNIANTANSYLVPKDGTPLAGLIQDHVIAGVLLSIRGRFFLRSDYQHLVFSGLSDNHNPITLLPPTVRKPCVLWSGKQVISTVLLNLIPKGKPPLNLDGKAKIGHKSWITTAEPCSWSPGGRPLLQDELWESSVIFRQGELLCGVLDKAHYGPTPYGLVHCCYEMYGPESAGRLLTSLARVFTTFLQMRGFTLGVEDILVTEMANKERKKIIKASTKCGPAVAAKAFGLGENPKTSKIEQKYRTAQYGKDEAPLKELDLCMKSRTDEVQNDITKACMPYGLDKGFPANNLQLMVQSGAKGSSVNTMQISCLLGQIELEGRRPPLMCTGRSLPSFLAYDTSPRAGGFVSGRFLTGIRPQEYFFHCMAGREGLVDTAVKTSRSGYLQRCIIKHLEGLVVAYDMTVRDSDGSLVQFQYGEDGLDILHTPFLTEKQLPFLVRNHGCLLGDEDVQKLEKVLDTTSVKKQKKKVKKYLRKHGPERRPRDSPFLAFCQDLAVVPSGGENKKGRSEATWRKLDKWRKMDDEDKVRYMRPEVPEPVLSSFRPDRYLGSVSENHQRMVDQFAKENHNLFVSDEQMTSQSSAMTSRSRYEWLMNVKHMRALVEPGQAVGLLAAQSIGEPSTQMTLNTFHFAGRGEMNVTLGIPRLREILMTASQTLKTPAMEAPVLSTAKSKRIKQLQKKLTKVTFDKVLARTHVTETTVIKEQAKHRSYKIRLEYLPSEHYKDQFLLTPDRITRFVERKFLPRLDETVGRLVMEMAGKKSLSSAKVKSRVPAAAEAGDGDEAGVQADVEDDIADDDLNDGDATADKNRRRQQDDVDYDGEEEERGEVEVQSDSELEEEDFDSDRESGEEEVEEKKPELDLSQSKGKKRKRASTVAMDQMRVNAVLQACTAVTKYEYDAESELWSEVTLELSLTSNSKLDMTTVLELVARRAVVWETSRIRRCFLSQNKMAPDQPTILKTEGVNLQELHRHDRMLDVDRIYTNDVHAIATVYGIEAAARAIVKELRGVFAAYGIDVNYRHLSLIADYMTFEGHYKPFNRIAMESNASPIQKMTFETAMHFIKSATISGAHDNLQSPSSRLVVGQPVYGGTGSFDLIQPLAVPQTV